MNSMTLRDSKGHFAKGSIPQNAAKRKNKTYEQLYGFTKAASIKETLRHSMKGVNKGRVSYRKGKTYEEIYGENAELRKRSHERNTIPNYSNLHTWLRDTYGHAQVCENVNCDSSSTAYQYALLSGKEYIKKRDNFITLCVKCHKNYDLGKIQL